MFTLVHKQEATTRLGPGDGKTEAYRHHANAAAEQGDTRCGVGPPSYPLDAARPLGGIFANPIHAPLLKKLPASRRSGAFNEPFQ